MDEPTFHALANDAITRLCKVLDRQDPDVVEAVLEAGVLKISFPSGLPFVLNTQRPAREIWLAADRRAWHFRYDGAVWRDNKTGKEELFATLTELIKARAQLTLAL